MPYKYKLVVFIGCLIVVLGIGYVWLSKKAESFFFYPDSVDYGASPIDEKLAFETVQFESADKVKLHGWFVPAVINEQGEQNAMLAKGTVIQVHGNAANITNHWSFVSWLPSLGYNVFVFDYRGYGQSENIQPTIKGLYEDTQVAILYVVNRKDINNEQLFILGQSLGGNNSLAALAGLPQIDQDKICAMVIDSTFYSYSAIANDKLKGSGVLVGNKYSANHSLEKLRSIPILFLHGKVDRIIPYQHTEQLYGLGKENRSMVLIEGADHLAALYQPIFGTKYTDQVIKFFDENLKKCITRK